MNHVPMQLLSLAAFAALALAMERHQKEVFGHPLALGHTRLLRTLGCLAMAAALAVAVRGQDAALGLVAWFGHISVAPGLVLLALSAINRHRARR